MNRRGWVGVSIALAWLLVTERAAEASGNPVVLVLMLVGPLLVSIFFGLLGFGLLLVGKEHRRLFLVLYGVCMGGAWFLDRWLPAWLCGVIALLPILFALHDRGGWKALLGAALVAPALAYGFHYLTLFTANVSPWLLPFSEALPLVPFSIACWHAEKKKLALLSVPVFLVGSYLFTLLLLISN